MFRKINLWILLALAVMALASTPVAARETGWAVAPYLWGVAIDGEDPDIDASFGDILDNANFAFSLHTEYRTDQWSFVFDPTYIELEVEGPMGGDINIDIWLVEAWAGYVVAENLEAIGGARFQDQEANPKSAPVKFGDDWTDWFLGLRWGSRLSDNWELVLRGDVVVSGDSDSATNALIFFNRRMGENKNMLLNLGYRYFDSDFDNDESGLDAYTWEVVQDGPTVGYTWMF